MTIRHTLQTFNRLGFAIVAGVGFAVLVWSPAGAQQSQKQMVQSAKATAGERAKQGDYLRGLKAWEQNCARCHNARDPKEYSDALWKPVITHMRIRAGLTGQEARDILKFIQDSN
ncbi:MAG TPA: hypothetical protein VKA50_14530 [Gammaproteobacteria bacterium]|nr:hypothetical protein [Gammaproteobacteria bacterium]